MKRLLVLASIATMGVSGTAFGQSGVNEANLMQKVSKAEAATQDPKKNTKAATWITLGDANYNATIAPIASLYRGLSELEMMFMMGKNEQSTDTINGVQMNVASYDYVDVYLTNGVVSFWKTKKAINPNGLEKAEAAYMKAYELDKDNAATLKKVQQGLTNVYNWYKQIADNNFTQQNLPVAASEFAKAYDLLQKNVITVADTTSSFNAGLIYAILKDYSNGEKYLSAALKDGLAKGGDTYYYLNLCYTGEGKNAEAKQVLMDGIKAYPMNSKLVEGLLSVYAATGEDPNEIIPLVNEAIQNDPKNPELYAGLGRVYDKLGQPDKSIEAFKQALALAPDDFATNYNIGLMLIKRGDEANNALNDKMFTSTESLKAEEAAVNAMYAEALAPLEKAHELQPDDITTVELLKNLYFRFRDDNAQYMEKYKHYNELLESMQQ